MTWLNTKLNIIQHWTALSEGQVNRVKAVSFICLSVACIYINFPEMKIIELIMIIKFPVLPSGTRKWQHECGYKQNNHFFSPEEPIRT